MRLTEWVFPRWHWGHAPLWVRCVNVGALAAAVLLLTVFVQSAGSGRWMAAAVGLWASQVFVHWWVQRSDLEGGPKG